MRVVLPYGKKRTVTIEVPDKNVLYLIDRGEAPALKNPQEEIRKALRNPIGTYPLSELVHQGDKVIIVGDDITRPTPKKTIFPVLLDELNAAGVSDADIEVIIALGTHREMSDKEIRDTYGGEIVDRVLVMNHDYKDHSSLVDLGETESGIPVSLNKNVYEADFVIGVGNIAPHNYAGWGGGGKIIQPGVCGEETTAATHLMGAKFKPISQLLGNINQQVRREIDTVALKAGLNLILNTVLNQKDEVYQIVIGNPIQAFSEGVKTAGKIYCRKVPRFADVIVVSSYPADIDYWQAGKAVDCAHLAVKPGGTIVLFTSCPEGISSMHPIFAERATMSYNENLKAIEDGEIEDVVAGAALLMHAQITERAEVICYSDRLSEGDVEALGFKRADTPQDAIEMALKSQGRDAEIGILRYGEIIPLIQ